MKMNQYDFTAGPLAHIYCSALQTWANASQDREEAIKRRLQWVGPLSWFLPWRSVWRLSDDFERSKHIRNDLWDLSKDPEACAAISLAKWRETVEPWLEAMRDPVAFVEWYQHRYWGRILGFPRAAVFARAGMKNQARAWLQWEYDRRNRTFEQSLSSVSRIIETAQIKKSEAELADQAAKSVELGRRRSDQALAFSRHIGVEIVEKDD